MSEASDPLYRKELLRLAADAAGAGRLPQPHAAATAANPACGDRITMQVAVAGGRVTALAHDTHACVITQASAAILGAHAAGHTKDDLAALKGAVAAMLKGGAVPSSPFAGYAVFEGVAAHPGRHSCVLLPLTALIDALETGEPGAQRSQA
jgi:NifU-like protein involved in Fe-S cluster formation